MFAAQQIHNKSLSNI